MQDDVDYTNDGYAPAGGGIARWVPAAVVLGAVGGFVALAWYAYNAGVQSLDEEDLLVVEADKSPVKEKPEDPGGMKFPNQDKTVYETFANNPPPSNAERVLPTPEEPIAQLDAPISQEPKAESSGGPEQVIGTPAPEKPAGEPAEKVAAVESAKAEVKEASPSAQAEKPAEPAREEKVAALTTRSVPGVKPAPAAGAAKIQLGAYRSEQEANRSWDALQKKFSELSDKSPLIVRADLGPKGVFYRLRVAGFSDTDAAKGFCKGLSAKGQACILASN